MNRSMHLPHINPRYQGPVAQQKATLSAQGSIWHPVLPIDREVLMRRSERLREHRARTGMA